MIKEKEYQIALSEVDDILHFTDEKIVSQIPSSFLKSIKENKDVNYISSINPYMPLEEQDITEEAKAIISLIYRSYIADEEEKEYFRKKDNEELENIENQKREKYNPDNIFKNKNTKDQIIQENTNNEINQETAIAVIKENAFSKICKKIKNIIAKIIKKK